MELKNISGVLFGILLVGSIWGMMEATLGAVLHLKHFPHTGAIMSSIGMFLISTAIQVYRPKNPLKFAFGIGVIASMLKCLDLLIPGQPTMAVINPAIAIIVESLVFGALLLVLQRQYEKYLAAKPAVGILSAYLSYTGFGLIFTYLGLGSKYWLNKTFSEFLGIIATEGTWAAVLTAPAVLAGFYAGNALGSLYRQISGARLFYHALSFLIVGIWLFVILI